MSDEVPVSGKVRANPGASKTAISFHYDLGNEFFRLFLDRECCYSCAMYEKESDSLEAAQQRKLEYHIQQACADGAARVLDIGCGWGALQKQLGQEHQVKSRSDHVPDAPFNPFDQRLRAFRAPLHPSGASEGISPVSLNAVTAG